MSETSFTAAVVDELLDGEQMTAYAQGALIGALCPAYGFGIAAAYYGAHAVRSVVRGARHVHPRRWLRRKVHALTAPAAPAAVA